MKTGTVHHEAPDTGATCCVYPKGEVRYSTDWREVTCSACISFRPKGVSVTETSIPPKELVLAATAYSVHEYRVLSDKKPPEARKAVNHEQYAAFMAGAKWALERAAKLLDDRVAALQKCGGDTYLQVCECSVMAREIRALSVSGDSTS